MTKLYISLIVLLITISSFSQNVYISEINYTASNPGIELTGVGETDLSGWALSFYKGNNRKEVLSLRLPLTQTLNNNILWIPVDNMPKGHPKGAGVALINNNGDVVEFLYSYDTPPFEAKDGLAKGYISEDVGSTTGENSIQRVLDPATNKPMGWTVAPPTQGNPTAQKSLSVTKDQIEDFNIYPNPARNGKISITTKNSLDKNVVIYSILGSVVYNKTVRSNEVINLENLSTGLYLVQVEEDEKVSVRKLLIN